MFRLFRRLAAWLAPPAVRPLESRPFLSERGRVPSNAELLGQLKNTAYTCASLNASVCAAFSPRLYVRTKDNQPNPRCLTRSVEPTSRQFSAVGERIEQVLEHPLLELLAQVNPAQNGFDLLELTTLSLETFGLAYWLMEFGPLDTPIAIWPLPVQQVIPWRRSGSERLVDAYLYRGGGSEIRLDPEEVIAFRYPDLRDPYCGGLSPLRACFEQAKFSSELAQFKQDKFANHALPDAILSPEEVISDEERQRLETQWNARMRRGAGQVLVADSALRVQMLEHSMGDLAALADLRATKEDIANAFGVPIAFLTTQTNLANLQAAERQHLAQTIRPRLRRRDEKLNEQLVPLFDPTGRLFLASEDPVPGNRELWLKEREILLKYGVVSIDEIRAELGLPARRAS